MEQHQSSSACSSVSPLLRLYESAAGSGALAACMGGYVGGYICPGGYIILAHSRRASLKDHIHLYCIYRTVVSKPLPQQAKGGHRDLSVWAVEPIVPEEGIRCAGCWPGGQSEGAIIEPVVLGLGMP
eukprot:1192610-Pyramimonas_sp.AAC.1